ncbi:helix-turn-helix domain-containing protein [Nocardia stercoris]|uniref:DNA-binding protein n=1 Tax=Nocardia stercoris TaxID=2483361 RepID=A0A3M2KQW1_9NOCA|nr:helix-turn-helix domain-containing protein [Nocardia stercoris]RMI28037.1 DNA-binding protein [Nocardia stercoris]
MAKHLRTPHEDEPTGSENPAQHLLENPTISVPDAARLLGIGRSTAYAAVKTGELPAIRVGHLIRIPSRWMRKILHLESDPDEDPR